jgi:hypothetical protein
MINIEFDRSSYLLNLLFLWLVHSIHLALHDGMGVLVFFFPCREFFLILLFRTPHLVGKQAVVGVVGLLLHRVASFLLHRRISPVYPKLSDSGLVSEDGATGVGDQMSGLGRGAFFLSKVLREDVVYVVSDPDELLASIAYGNDDSSNT